MTPKTGHMVAIFFGVGPPLVEHEIIEVRVTIYSSCGLGAEEY